MRGIVTVAAWLMVATAAHAEEPPAVAVGSDVSSPVLGTLKWVPPGTFTMGSSPSEPGHELDEAPPHQVTLTRGVWMMEREVTQAMWQGVMGTNPAFFSECGEACPVENVTWEAAVDFAQRLSAQEGVTYRLPTEAEWEYAARGGETERYAGADDLDSVGWFWDNSSRQPQRGCERARNAYGLCDMSGNVWEWTGDAMAPYPSEPATDPTGASTGRNRVYRGGSWSNGAADARVASRSNNDPLYRGIDLGLRLVRTR